VTDPMSAATWESLSSIVGLAAFLGLIFLPVVKSLGAKGRLVQIYGLVGGIVIALIAVGLTRGMNPRSIADAVLSGFIAAAMATGVYHVIKPERQATNLGLKPDPPVFK